MPSRPNLIALHVGSVKQLFNSFDPSPFLEKDIDKEAENYLVSWAAELDTKKSISLVIYIAGGHAVSPEAQLVPDAFKNYFSYRANQARLEIHELLRVGRRSLVVGSIVLLGSLLASNYVTHALSGPPIGAMLSESLIILGWVANWRPLEIFLYDWWPMARKRKLYLRLADAIIEIRHSE